MEKQKPHLLNSYCGQDQAGRFSTTCLLVSPNSPAEDTEAGKNEIDLPKVTLLESGRILPRTAGPQGAVSTTTPHCLHDAPFALAPNDQLGSS